MGFTPDRKAMYFTDSAARHIYLLDYDQATGALSNKRIWVETSPDQGKPDGLTVDSEGFVWSARWDGSVVCRYSPDGVEVDRVTFPAKKVSSIAFGGDGLEDVYVTTALAGGKRSGEGAGAGALFRFSPGIRGVPEFYSRVRV
jgi:sugar lactone lactonase YvrE